MKLKIVCEINWPKRIKSCYKNNNTNNELNHVEFNLIFSILLYPHIMHY